MRRFRSLTLVTYLALIPTLVSAEEPAREFVESLRSRGFYDEALDYLNKLPGNAAVSKSFQETVLFERGVTYLQRARGHKDLEKKNEWLAEGQKDLQKFVAEHKDHSLANQARMQLGNALVERARLVGKRGEQAAGEARTQLMVENRSLYGDARKSFEDIAVSTAEQLKAFPPNVADPMKVEEQDRLRMDLLQSRLLVAATSEELAETFAKSSGEQKDGLKGAAELYHKIYQGYRTRMAGLYARMYEARCQQKLGQHKEALVMFEELLANPDEPDAFHTLRMKVVALAADSWMEEKAYQKILDSLRPLIDGAKDSEQKTPEILELQVKLALAAKALALEKMQPMLPSKRVPGSP